MCKKIYEDRFLELILQSARILGCESVVKELKNHDCCPAGKVYLLETPVMEGHFWCYQCDDFSIDIHRFHITKECFNQSQDNLDTYGRIFSTYIVQGSGEIFHPYQKLSSDALFAMTTDTSKMNFILHKNMPFVSVEICFRDTFLQKNINYQPDENSSRLKEIFISTDSTVTKKIRKIALEIMACTMHSPAADIFFEAKAKEWLSILLDSYANRKKNLPQKNCESLSTVARYIEDHYAATIPQKTLQKISMMSGTALKTGFRKKYGMTITEYTQRQRVRVAEALLVNTDLSIRDVAKAVGYSSQSRFTQIFKRYSHCTPSQLKKTYRSPGS